MSTFPCGHPREGDNIYSQVKDGKRGSFACKTCRAARASAARLAERPPCPKCKSKNATQSNNHGIRGCLDCGTRYNSMGIRVYGDTAKHKGIPAGRIEVGRGTRWFIGT